MYSSFEFIPMLITVVEERGSTGLVVVPVECVARPVFLATHTKLSIDKTTRTKLLVLILHLCVCVCVYPGPINDLFLLLKEMMTNAVV